MSRSRRIQLIFEPIQTDRRNFGTNPDKNNKKKYIEPIADPEKKNPIADTKTTKDFQTDPDDKLAA